MCNGDFKVETVEEVSLDYVLRYKNAEGFPYLSDITRWLGTTDLKLAKKVQIKLKELQDR